jgi:hypothetical protein
MLVIAREMKLVREENLRAAGATASDLSTLVARLHPPGQHPARLRRRD